MDEDAFGVYEMTVTCLFNGQIFMTVQVLIQLFKYLIIVRVGGIRVIEQFQALGAFDTSWF